MKYLVAMAWELDGHAGSSAIVLPTLDLIDRYIAESLKDEDGKPMGKITNRIKEENGYTCYGEWECGQFSVMVRKFKTYSDMLGKELFTRTG